jgi:hypothetical protein
MPSRYYVTAQRIAFPYSTKRLCGPFERHRAAFMMQQPIRRAIADDPEYAGVTLNITTVTISAKDLKAGTKRWPRGAIDPGRIALADVIDASRPINY